MRFDKEPIILINNSNSCIEENINALSSTNLGLCAQNILAQTRNLLDGLVLYIYINVLERNQRDVNTFNEIIALLKRDIKHYRPIIDLYEYIEVVGSHFTLEQWMSIEIVNVYADYLFNLKSFAKEKLDIEILKNLYLFPFNEHRNDDGFYINVGALIKTGNISRVVSTSYYYYIEKKNRIYTDDMVYYEYVVTPAKDKVSKFDRTTCYSKHNLCVSHAYRMSFSRNRVALFDKFVEVNIIEESYVSIRPIELTNLFRITGINFKVARRTAGYNQVMNFLNFNNISLYKALFDEDYFKSFSLSVDNCPLLTSLLYVRSYILKKRNCFKSLTYLLCLLNNRVLKSCIAYKQEDRIDEIIKLSKYCLMFEEQPFALSLPDHNTSLSILIECLGDYCTKGQLLQRNIKNNISENNRLYTKIEELSCKDIVDSTINEYNDSLNQYSIKTRLIKRNNKITIFSEESDCLDILLNLNVYKKKSFVGGRELINKFLLNPKNLQALDPDKLDTLNKCFDGSSLLCIKGSAGTGKTFLLRYLVEALGDNHFIFGCNTYSALNNLKRRLSDLSLPEETKYLVVKQLRKETDDYYGNSILILDECSTISNVDFITILKRHSFKAIVLAGDDYQIESIKFGNWFGLCSTFFPNQVSNLSENHRTSDSNLLELWKEVRCADFTVLDGRIQMMGFIKKLSSDVFRYKNDQIVLCLNYDGLYGINNVNRYMQELNSGTTVSWNVWTFKVNDPVLFNDSSSFRDYFYNNQKGQIIKIDEKDNRIFFTIRVEFEPGLNTDNSQFVKIASINEKYIDYIIEIDKKDDEDDSLEKPNFVVPFQLAYAISIHKSQGLEYDNVNIIICEEIEDSISFNVFYTAITRAKKQLQIFSNKGSLRTIINNFSIPSFNEDGNTLYGVNKRIMDIGGLKVNN